jgi:hypothetical protein
MKTIFSTMVEKDPGGNATGLRVPPEAVSALGAGKRVPVKVTIGSYTYRSTVAPYNGVFMLPLSAEHRDGAGVKAGDAVEVILELDQEPRTVVVPEDLAAALAGQPGAAAAFSALSYTMQKETVRQVETAKALETRNRRIAGIVAKLTSA